LIDFWCFNATFNNIAAISWRPVLVVEEAGVPGENQQRTSQLKVLRTVLYFDMDIMFESFNGRKV
jgi:hypothetical protein